jgi:hypothetical protein
MIRVFRVDSRLLFFDQRSSVQICGDASSAELLMAEC